MHKKKLLILTDWFAPGYKAGGPIRSCLNIAIALRNTFQIHVITTDRDMEDTQPYPNVIADKWTIYDEGIAIYYFSPQNLRYKNLKTLILVLAPHVIYLNSMFSQSFTIWPLWMKVKNIYQNKIVLAPRGMLHAGAMQYKFLKKRLFLFLLNFSGISKKIFFQATDHQESKDIKQYFGANAKVEVVSNLPMMDIQPWTSSPKKAGELRLVFVSRVNPKKNLNFLLEMLPETEGEITLDIIGPIDSDQTYWHQCRKLIAKLPPYIAVNYLGAFPHHEVQKRLRAYHFFVLPTHGENFGHAIFEAMAAGKPVMISDQTPWRNLAKAKAGWDLALDNKAFKLAMILALRMNQTTYDEWSEATWNYANDFIHQPSLIQDYQELFA